MRPSHVGAFILLWVVNLQGQVARRIGDDQPLQKQLSALPTAQRKAIDKALEPEIIRWLKRFDDEDDEELKEDSLSIQRSLRYEQRGNLFLVQAYNVDGCGAVGNCQFFLLDSKDNVLLSNVVAYYLTVLDVLHNGLPDLLLGEHISASQTGQTWYRFNGSRYEAVRCAIDTYGMPYEDTKRHREFGVCQSTP